MTLKQIAALGRKLTLFLALFADCFGRRDARSLLHVYVKGQLSNLHRKNAEAIALQFNTAPRTLQRFLESIKWDEEKLRDRCQQIVATEHAHPDAIGCVDESGTAKSGNETVGASRQWNGNRGKVDNCVVAVHLSYSAPGFQVLLDSAVYLPEDWANDPARRKKLMCQTRSSSAPSQGSCWTRSTSLCPMVCASQRGRSTSCTVATASFSMA
jgi:SRSO17 transposase